MKEKIEYGQYRYVKACYLCGWFTLMTATATDLCGQCGKHTVVYAAGRIRTCTQSRGWLRSPLVTRRFEILETQNIHAQAHLGVATAEGSTATS